MDELSKKIDKIQALLDEVKALIKSTEGEVVKECNTCYYEVNPGFMRPCCDCEDLSDWESK